MSKVRLKSPGGLVKENTLTFIVLGALEHDIRSRVAAKARPNLNQLQVVHPAPIGSDLDFQKRYGHKLKI